LFGCLAAATLTVLLACRPAPRAKGDPGDAGRAGNGGRDGTSGSGGAMGGFGGNSGGGTRQGGTLAFGGKVAECEANRFGGASNVTFAGTTWTADFSHGEMVRNGYDETMTISPRNSQHFFQGWDPYSTASTALLP
jgi:hypothetical protein